MTKKNVILLCGGGSSEHEVSLKSAQFIYDNLIDWKEINLYWVEVCKDGSRRDKEGKLCELRRSGELVYPEQSIKLDFAIPCIHGYPGETGDIQSVFKMMELPYLGCSAEASVTCFNKVTTKLWLDAIKIPNTPFCYLTSLDTEQLDKASEFFNKNPDVYIKASNQGSSIGCYHCKDQKNLVPMLKQAFEHSEYVLIEKTIEGRELEMSVYEISGELKLSDLGEIICPNDFYSYEEKYAEVSETEAIPKAAHVDAEVTKKMKAYASSAFKALKLRHLSRIDFFLSQDGEIFLNEINTFPGMTPISLFPLMMQENGDSFKLWLKSIIKNESR